MTTIFRILGSLAAVTGVFLVGVAAASGASTEPHPLVSGSAQELFERGVVPKLIIEVSPEALDKLKERPRRYVLGTVREGALIYTNVSIRLKGGPGSFRSLEDKPAFTLNFGRQAPKQKFHGLKKLHLNNSVQDRTYMAEKVSRELFNAAGVPAPRAGHAVVQFNGRNLGFYVLIEGIDKHFLGRHFQDASGILYDGKSQSDVNRRSMLVNSGENRTDHSGLRALAAAAAEPDLNLRLVKLNETLDVERFLSFLATEVMLCHWDGYAMNRNNYRVYHDRHSNRMVFLPQGTDQVFQRQNTPIIPSVSGLVARSVLDVPELRQRYKARVAELLTNVWQLTRWTNRIQEIGAQVQASLQSTHPKAAGAFPERANAFSRRFQQRVRELERKTGTPPPELAFDGKGALEIVQWKPKIDLGEPLVRAESPEAGSPYLYINAQESSTASWRSRLILDRGHYAFHGRMQTKGVKLDSEDPKSGVGLRISRQAHGRRLEGDITWTPVTFEFDVDEDDTPIELVCELRASQGEVWFDRESLKLVKRE